MDWTILISTGQWLSIMGLFTWNLSRQDSIKKDLCKKIDDIHKELINHRIYGNGKE